MHARKWLVMLCLSASVIVASCGGGAENELSDADRSETPQATQPPKSTRTVVASPTPRPTTAPIPPTPTSAPETILLVEQGFYQIADASEFDVTWFALLENHSQRAANFFRVQALLFDDAGVLLSTSEDYVYLWGSQTGVATSSATVPRSAVRLEVRVGEPRSRDAVQTQAFPTVGNVEVIRDRFYGAIRGLVQSPWDADVEDLSVVCLGRDGTGSVVVAEASFLALLPAGASAVGECDFIEDELLAKIAAAEMHVMWTSITDVAN